jgi:hypothetical protein
MNSPIQTDDPADARTTGLPGLRSWRAVYLLVLAIFILWVVLLTILSRVFQ